MLSKEDIRTINGQCHNIKYCAEELLKLTEKIAGDENVLKELKHYAKIIKNVSIILCDETKESQ